VGHLDSHQVGQGPPPSSSSFTFAVAGHLPYPRPRPFPEAPPQAPAPPLVARPQHLPYTLVNATPADARHQHDVLWHHLDASKQHHPPPSVGYALSYGKHALPPLHVE